MYYMILISWQNRERRRQSLEVPVAVNPRWSTWFRVSMMWQADRSHWMAKTSAILRWQICVRRLVLYHRRVYCFPERSHRTYALVKTMQAMSRSKKQQKSHRQLSLSRQKMINMIHRLRRAEAMFPVDRSSDLQLPEPLQKIRRYLFSTTVFPHWIWKQMRHFVKHLQKM